MVVGAHGNEAVEEAGEGGVAVEDGGVLGVDVEDVEGFGALTEVILGAGDEAAQDGRLEGMEEEGDGGSGGERRFEGVGFDEVCGGEGACVGVRGEEGQVRAGDGCEVWVELDAGDLMKGMERGGEHGTTFAGAYVEEGVAVNGVGGRGLQPQVDEGVEDGGRDGIVRGDVEVVGVADDEGFVGDEAAGVGAVALIEGVNGRGFGDGRRHAQDAGFAGRHAESLAVVEDGEVGGVESEQDAALGGDAGLGPRGCGGEVDGGA